MKIAYIQAQWHADVTANAKTIFIETLEAHGYDLEQIDFFEAPGSLEIPLLAQKLAETGRYQAVACSGFVVDGGIYRHEFVAHAILQGITNASLKTGIPILSAILTPQDMFAEDGSNPDQHHFFKEHMNIKGKELAEATHQMINTLQKI